MTLEHTTFVARGPFALMSLVPVEHFFGHGFAIRNEASKIKEILDLLALRARLARRARLDVPFMYSSSIGASVNNAEEPPARQGSKVVAPTTAWFILDMQIWLSL